MKNTTSTCESIERKEKRLGIQFAEELDVYAVVKRGTEYEVRCWTFKRGDLIDDALVNTFRFESVADEIARALAEGAEL